MIIIGLLLGTVLLGGIVGFIGQEKLNLKILLSFSGAFLLGLSFLHIIPELFESPSKNVSYFILLGFVLQILLEYLSKGVEHGHSHPIHGSSKILSVLPILLGLSLHSFLEGIPITAMSQIDESVSYQFLIGICLHKFPAAIVLTSLLLASHYSRISTVVLLIIFAMMSPLGYYFSGYLSHLNVSLDLFTALVLGSFLHISTTIIFENDASSNHNIDWTKLSSILVGFLVAVLLS